MWTSALPATSAKSTRLGKRRPGTSSSPLVRVAPKSRAVARPDEELSKVLHGHRKHLGLRQATAADGVVDNALRDRLHARFALVRDDHHVHRTELHVISDADLAKRHGLDFGAIANDRLREIDHLFHQFHTPVSPVKVTVARPVSSSVGGSPVMYAFESV